MIRSDVIERGFAAIGARVEVGAMQIGGTRVRGRALAGGFAPEVGLTVDVVATRRGERFQLLANPAHEVSLVVAHARPDLRHLLLLVRDEGPLAAPFGRPALSRFLCGHDERHWFAAILPTDQPVATVAQAMEALRPQAVRGSLLRHGVKARDRDRRRNAGCLRQGEWFFMPRPDFTPPDGAVLRDEPLRRGSGKPHLAQELYRQGGTTVYLPKSPLPLLRGWLGPDPNLGLTEAQFREFHRRLGAQAPRHWQTLQRDPVVLVRGRVTHPDHATLTLPFWHRVLPNLEGSGGRGSRRGHEPWDSPRVGTWNAAGVLAFLD